MKKLYRNVRAALQGIIRDGITRAMGSFGRAQGADADSRGATSSRRHWIWSRRRAPCATTPAGWAEKLATTTARKGAALQTLADSIIDAKWFPPVGLRMESEQASAGRMSQKATEQVPIRGPAAAAATSSSRRK